MFPCSPLGLTSSLCTLPSAHFYLLRVFLLLLVSLGHTLELALLFADGFLLLPAYLLFLLVLRCRWLVSHCMEIQALIRTEISTLTFLYTLSSFTFCWKYAAAKIVTSSRPIQGLTAIFTATSSSLGWYVFGSEISYNKAPPRLPGLGC